MIPELKLICPMNIGGDVIIKDGGVFVLMETLSKIVSGHQNYSFEELLEYRYRIHIQHRHHKQISKLTFYQIQPLKYRPST